MVASPEFELQYIEPQGMQAIYTHHGKWYYLSADYDYEPREFPDEKEAFRHHYGNSGYEARKHSFPDLDSLTNAVYSEFQPHIVAIPDVPLKDIIHLFPEEMQKEWASKQPKGNKPKDSPAR